MTRSSRKRAFFALLAVIGLAGLCVAPARAANTRVAISDFEWSKEPQIDLGESVIWDWIGPDTMHSVTGQEPNATQWDSDPDSSMPQHDLGDTYRLTFNHPGSYLFVCKMHSSVRGTVTVSNNPGDPDSDPGPQDPLKLDMESPLIERVRLDHLRLGWRGKGTALNFEIGEPGLASIDYYQRIKRGKGKKAKVVKRFRGYTESKVHVGNNRIRFAARSKTFKPKPGKYVAYFRVDDLSWNASREFTLHFEIKSKKSARR